MSIPQQINRVDANVKLAHAVVEEMGGDSVAPTSANLAIAISTIPQGASLTGSTGEHITTTVNDGVIGATLSQGVITTLENSSTVATNAQIDTGTLTTIRGWTVAGIVRAITQHARNGLSTGLASATTAPAATATIVQNLGRLWGRIDDRTATPTNAEIDTGTATAVRGWSIANIVRAITQHARNGNSTGLSSQTTELAANATIVQNLGRAQGRINQHNNATGNVHNVTAAQIPVSAATAARLGMSGASANVAPMVAQKVEVAPKIDELSKLKQELRDIDLESTPYLRRSIVGTATPEDIKELKALDKKANSLQKVIKARETQ